METHLNLHEKSYQETLAIIEPMIKQYGISRVAELTGLDNLGIPVFSAIRPLSKSVAASQGKGFCNDSAKCSAIIESIETALAENILPSVSLKSESELEESKLSFVSPNYLGNRIEYLSKKRKHNWINARILGSRKEILIPHVEASLDSTNPEVLLYGSGSTGIASGNSFEEAVIHGVCENIERLANTKAVKVHGFEHSFLNKLEKKQSFNIYQLKNAYEIPSFRFEIQSQDLFDNQALFYGTAAHPNKEIAIQKAFLEAVQSRMTAIVGAREDLKPQNYIYNKEITRSHSDEVQYFQDISSQCFSNKNETLLYLIEKAAENQEDILIYEYLKDPINVIKVRLIKKTEARCE